MRFNFLGLLTAFTSFAFAAAPSSIDGVNTPADFEAYQRGWYQDGVTDAAIPLAKFKSPDGNRIWRVAIPHQPCTQTYYCAAGQINLTVHKMRLEMTAAQPSQVVYYAMLGDQKLAVMRETLGDDVSTLKILANEVSGYGINERALALYAIACKRLSIEQKQLEDGNTLDYKVTVQLDTQLNDDEAKIERQLATIVQDGQFLPNINIIASDI